jgi:hypothetical protein
MRMKNETFARCYGVQDVPTFFLEGLDSNCAVLELHLGDQNVRLTREAFYSMVGSLARMAVELLEVESNKTVAEIH